MKKAKTYFNWSTGKDAAMALHILLKDPSISVESLLTSVNGHHNRVSMHGLSRDMMSRQIEAIGIPQTTIELPENPSMDEYNEILLNKVEELKSQGYTDTAFGDIFLEDLRNYREEQLANHQIKAHFPLWKKDTKQLISHLIKDGFRAVLMCTKSALLDESFIGREIDEDFLKDLPDNVDPCGENGEFHTFCFDGPIFNKAVEFELGEKIFRSYENPDASQENKKIGFWFQDLLPK